MLKKAMMPTASNGFSSDENSHDPPISDDNNELAKEMQKTESTVHVTVSTYCLEELNL